MKKEEAIRILFQCAEYYQKNLANRTILFVCANNSLNKITKMEALFEKTNFMHLTGVKFQEDKRLSADTFYTKCLEKRLSMDDFELSLDGTTEMKLQILPKLVASSSLSANMVGDYYARRPALFTEKLAGGIRGCVGFVYDAKRGYYVPNTVLNIDIRDNITNRLRIIAVYQKNKHENTYAVLVYRAKKIDWTTIKYPDEVRALVMCEENVNELEKG